MSRFASIKDRMMAKLVSLFLITSIVPLVTVLLVVYIRSRSALTESAVSILVSISELKEKQLVNWVTAVRLFEFRSIIITCVVIN